MSEFFLEIRSEEMPSKLQYEAKDRLLDLIKSNLENFDLSFKDCFSAVTPRRIVIKIDGLPKFQQDSIEEKKGPKINSAESSIEGFLRSVKLERHQVEERETSKGTFLFALIERKGISTNIILENIIPEILGKFYWKKSMKWGRGNIKWVRPIRSIISIFDNEIINFNFGHIKSSNLTIGHRTMSEGEFSVSNFKDYKLKVRNAYVMLSEKERMSFIINQIHKLAQNKNLSVIQDEDLLKEVVGLVEWPVVYIGKIDKKFMTLPPEILRASIRTHQKYFALKNSNNQLAGNFIVVSNISSNDNGEAIIKGNERVLSARLSDAQFFLEQDLNSGSEKFKSKLKGMLFHDKLGMMDTKTERIELLSIMIAKKLNFKNIDSVISASALSKIDLVSNIVGEFPHLQGIMGGYFASLEGYSLEISNAITKHYSPQGPSDVCPTDTISYIISLADKIDNLVGFWLIGFKPSGSGDPYGLRRAALGIIRIIVENKIELGISDFFLFTIGLYDKQGIKVNHANIIDELKKFVFARFKVFMLDQGIRHDLVSASLNNTNEDRLLMFLSCSKALQSFVNSEKGMSLLVSFKRATNIVNIEEKKDKKNYDEMPQFQDLELDAEIVLYNNLDKVYYDCTKALKKDDYNSAINSLLELSKPIDDFFDTVQVNVEDEILRTNRLKLLSKIRATFNQVANFSLVESL